MQQLTSRHTRHVDLISRSLSLVLILASQGEDEPLAWTGCAESYHYLKDMLHTSGSTCSSAVFTAIAPICHTTPVAAHTVTPRTDNSRTEFIFLTDSMQNLPSRAFCCPLSLVPHQPPLFIRRLPARVPIQSAVARTLNTKRHSPSRRVTRLPSTLPKCSQMLQLQVVPSRELQKCAQPHVIHAGAWTKKDDTCVVV